MDNKPLVTVIIPNYNRAIYLKETLESVLNQTYVNWEVFVVDDGSTDGSKEIVFSFLKRDTRINWIERGSIKKGASVCRNIGLDQSSGKYIVFLDSDDLLAPHCLNQRVKILIENPELDFAVFQMQFFNRKPKDLDGLWNYQTEESDLDRFLRLDSVWQTTGPIWKKSALIKIGEFNEDLQCWQDIDIHLKALTSNLNYNLFFNLPIDCYYRRNAENSISQENMNSIEKLMSKELLYGWVVANVSPALKAKPMLIHILLSSLNGFQFTFFKRLLSTNHKLLERKENQYLIQMLIMKKVRLTRLPFFNKAYQNLRIKLIGN